MFGTYKLLKNHEKRIQDLDKTAKEQDWQIKRLQQRVKDLEDEVEKLMKKSFEIAKLEREFSVFLNYFAPLAEMTKKHLEDVEKGGGNEF